MRRILSCVVAGICLLLANCTGTSLRSPVKDPGALAVTTKPPVLQSPVDTKPVPCEKKQVYAPPQPHIDQGPAVCVPGDPACDPTPRDPLSFHGAPKYELPPPVQAANEANAQREPCAEDPDKPPPCKRTGGGNTLGVLACALALIVALGLAIR